jgi:hypothetical protein
MILRTHRAGRIILDPLAFTNDLGIRRKRPRATNAAHLKFIRGLPCLICGSRKDIQAAHIRSRSAVYGKRGTGAGEKSSDHWTLPLCREHHASQHQGNELEFWARYGIDPFAVALALFAASGDEDAGEIILRNARRDA